MRPVSLTGETAEKFEQTEKILTRIINQLPQVVTCQVPPIPVSFFTAQPDEDQVLARYIFPVKGTLVQAAVHIEVLNENQSVTLQAQLLTGNSSMTEQFVINGKSQLVKLALPVEAGTMLIVRTAQNVERVWLGLLYRVHVSQQELVHVAIEQMEAANARIHN